MDYLEQKFRPPMAGAEALTAPTMTFAELSEWYFTYYAPSALKDGTIYDYRYIAERFLLPALGDLPLQDFHTMQLTAFFHDLPVSPTYCRNIYTTLRSIFTVALQNGLIDRHPCDHVLLPRKPLSAEEQKPHLTDVQARQLYRMTEDYDWFNSVVRFLLLTGVRSGEAFGLQWDDVDFEHNVIHIRRNLTNVASKHWLTTPKTKNSVRTLPMSLEVKELMLRQQKEQQDLLVRRTAAGRPFPHPEIVFTSPRGRYIDHNYTERKFKDFVAGTDFEDITLHSLRHANATLMLAAGVDLKVVSTLLGHSSIAITANLYTDVLDASKAIAADALAKQLAG